MTEWGVMPHAFAKRAGISRSHLLRLRKGEMEPSRRVMAALTEAASFMRGKSVYTVELFVLAHSDEALYRALVRPLGTKS
jgi:transcriptional regulator with XRE-family HTH domain